MRGLDLHDAGTLSAVSMAFGANLVALTGTAFAGLSGFAVLCALAAVWSASQAYKLLCKAHDASEATEC